MPNRNYLHPLDNQKFKLKNYTRQKEGTTKSGIRLQQIESFKPHIHNDYRYGVLAELPGAIGERKEIVVFGPYEEMQELTLAIESNPDKVFESIRPIAGSKSGGFYLNRPAPPTVEVQISREEQEHQDRANRMFPRQAEDTYPTSRNQEEKRARQAHLSQFKSEPSPKEPPTSLVNEAPDSVEAVNE